MDFREAEQRFRILEQRRAAGQLSLEAYRAALANLRVVDASGATWSMQEQTGQWFVYQNGQWIPALPPALGTSGPQQAVRPMPGQSGQQQATPRPAPGQSSLQPANPQPAPAATPRPAVRPMITPKPQPAARQITAVPREHRGPNLLLIFGLLAACLVCGGLAASGYLYSQGKWALPGLPSWTELTAKTGAMTPQPGQAEPTAQVKAAETTAISADGAPHNDSHGVSLAVPASALPEGSQVNLVASDLNASWRKALEASHTVDTPFYSIATQSKDDSAGRLALTFPAAGPQSRLLAVVDGEYLLQLAVTPKDGRLALETRAAPGDSSGMLAPKGEEGAGSIYYTVITPKSGSDTPGGQHLARLLDERSCTPDISIIGGAAINLCRQNVDGTIQVLLPTAQRDLSGQVDTMIEKIEAVMKKYADLGFTSANLSKSAPLTLRISSKITSPSYYPLNGILYIPVDTVTSIASKPPDDVYHEMAHWIQAVKYSTRIAYYSQERTWWLETSAENMVMLVDESYVGGNLRFYGTITQDNNTLALQASPYQWPSDFYVQAQLLKVNLCDSPACPLSQADFARAISEGIYPLMDGGKKSLVSANLIDYAFYLLGKPPAKANTSIPLSGPVKTGDGYGEYINVVRTVDTDIKYNYNGADPQMHKDSTGGKDALVVEAALQRDGVYPLIVSGSEGKNGGLPVQLVIQPGASFYYTIDDGELKYSDGSQELKLMPIHGQMGIKKVRLVALGINGGEVFKARVEPLDLSGAWVVLPQNKKTGGGLQCSSSDESSKVDNPDGVGLLMGTMVYMIGGSGDMQADPTGRNLDWSALPARLPASIQADKFTYSATALVSGEAIKFQAKLDIPKEKSSLGAPPVAAGPLTPPAQIAMAGLPAMALPALWLGTRRKGKQSAARKMMAGFATILLALVLAGCFGMGMYGSTNVDASLDKIEYIGGQDTGTISYSKDTGANAPGEKPLWKLTGKATYDVNFVIEATVTDQNGKDTTSATTCTGQITFPVTVYVFKDVKINMPEK